ncbi:MAG: ATP-binding protein [Cyanobacteria bacterium P01_A01_bin.114]
MRQSNSDSVTGRGTQDHDYYPVHLMGVIQSHGVLIALEENTLTILQVSQNSQDYLGVAPQALLGCSLSVLLQAASIEQLRQSLRACTDRPGYQLLSVTVSGKLESFDSFVHLANGQIVLELEPADERTGAELLSIQNTVAQGATRLRKIKDMTAFLQGAVEALQTLSGYERVMIYQFDAKQAGSVVAEVKPADEPSYLGLHYPATDIPALVRQLYQTGIQRFIPDLSAPQVGLIAAEHPLTKTPLDLSQSILRGVDACCIEYHQNMNVAAFWVVALVKDNQLWGLMTGHHQTAKPLAYPVRSACELLGQLVAAELGSKVNEDEVRYLTKLKAIQSDFVASIAAAEDFKQALIHPEPRLLDLVNAKGAAVCLDQDVTLVGKTPSLEQVQSLIDWALTTVHDGLFHTDCLSKQYPAALAFKTVASGVVILKISPLRRYLIFWFRPEVLQTVNWAGDPQSSVSKTDSGRVVFSPRTSFEQWQETVVATALPWQAAELENAEDLKSAIVGIVLNKADELAQINLDLERSNRELDSFAYAASHDLKEPLRGITNFANILIRRHGSDLDETGINRLKTLVRLAQRMDALIDALLRFSRLGQTELNQQPTDLELLLQAVIEVLTVSHLDGTGETDGTPQIKIPRRLPTVTCDSMLISEVFSNLISNALKYTDKPCPLIEIGYLTVDEWQRSSPNDEVPAAGSIAGPIFYVKDDGLGIHARHFQNIFRLFKRLHERDAYGGGTGVGLTLTQKIIERHGGHIWVTSTYGKGSEFYFLLR